MLGALTAGGVVLTVLGIAALLLFASGFVPLSGLQGYVAADLQQRLGPGWTVQTRKAGIVREDGSPQLLIQDVDFRHVSGVRLRAPEAIVRYNHWSVLTGQLALRSIAIQGVTLRLQVDSDGALVLDTGESRFAWRQGDAPQDSLRSETVLGEALSMLTSDGPLPSLEELVLRDSRLQLVAPDGTERIGLEKAQISIRQNEGGRTYRFRGVTDSGLKDIEIIHRRASEGSGAVDLIVHAFQLDDLERLMVGRTVSVLKGFPLAGTLRARGQRLDEITGEIRLGAGRIALPDRAMQPVAVDRIEATIKADRMGRAVELVTGTLASGATQLDLTGRLAFGEGAAWTLDGEARGAIEGEGRDQPQALALGRARLEGSGVSAVRLRSIELQGPRLAVTGAAAIEQTSAGPTLSATLSARQSSVRAMLAGWPRLISPFIREMIAERVETGEVESLNLAVNMPAEAFGAARRGEVIPDESVRVDVQGRGVHFAVGEGIPKLQDLQLTAVATGRTLQLAAATARVEMPRNRQITLTEGKFAIADTYAERPLGRSSFRASGGVDALAALMAVPAFREAAPGQIDPEAIKGRMDLRVTLQLPLVPALRSQDVLVQATGPLTGVGSETLLGPEKLENANLAANFDKGSLTLRGDARIGGLPAVIDIRQDQRGQGEAVVTMQLDQAARERRGFGMGGAVTGTVALRAVKPLGRRQDAPVKIELDLARAAIDGLLPGWTKPAGRPARVSFLVDLDDDEGQDINDIILDASPVQLRGKLSLDAKGGLQSASFSSVRLSPGDEMRVDIRKEGAVSKVTIRGQVIDSRPLLRMLTGPGAPPRRPQERSPDIDIDIATPILTGFNGEAVGNAAIKLSRRGGDMRQIEASGRIGRAPFTITQGPEGDRRVLRVRSQDGGGLLRFVDLYRRASGGDLSIDATVEGERLSGTIEMADFAVRGEPALRRVLGEQFAATGAAGTEAAGRAAASREAGTEVTFQRLRAGFIRTPSRVTIRDGVVWGNEIGVSAQGTIDYARDLIDLAGTFVPGFFLNNAVTNVPIIGLFLGGGGPNAGVFAVNFRVGGAASAPSVSINPLSAIAPGILRRFVDPLGGVPQGSADARQGR